MTLYELAGRVIEALEAQQIPYMVVGALSSSVLCLGLRMSALQA